MKIGMLTYGMKDNLTGIGQYAMHLSYAMRALSSDMTVILLNPYPESPLSWYHDFPTISLPSLALLPGVLVTGPVVMARVARRYGLDLIHDPCGIAPFVFPGRYKRVVTIHDAIPLIYPQYYPWLGNLVFRTMIPMARWSSHAVLTVSDSAKTDLLHHTNLQADQIVVTPLGIDVPDQPTLLEWKEGWEEFRQQRGWPRSYFLMVGAGHPRKNGQRAIEAVRVLRSEGEDVDLVMTGTALRTAKNSDGPGIWRVGHVDARTLHILYANATAVLVPSFYEGFGLPVLEAMAHGTAVVASPVSSLPELLLDNGLYADAGNTAAWVAQMRRLLHGNELRQTLGAQGYVRAHRFSWRVTAEQTLAVYRRILRGVAS